MIDDALGEATQPFPSIEPRNATTFRFLARPTGSAWG